MPRVDFYILPDQTPDGRLLLACRLAEKAYTLGHQVYIHAESKAQGQRLDDLLWTFRQGSFVPHALYPDAGSEPPPVLIGWATEPALSGPVLINLTPAVPAFFERCERVAELVDQTPEILTRSRERFRFYRQQGCPLESHKLRPMR